MGCGQGNGPWASRGPWAMGAIQACGVARAVQTGARGGGRSGNDDCGGVAWGRVGQLSQRVAQRLAQRRGWGAPVHNAGEWRGVAE
eukprot:5357137-Alexandrium_andersonii.AAC.1